MSKRILLVSGHLPSDVRGQLYGGEGKLNIELVHPIEAKLKDYCELTLYPDNRDLYRDIMKHIRLKLVRLLLGVSLMDSDSLRQILRFLVHLVLLQKQRQ